MALLRARVWWDGGCSVGALSLSTPLLFSSLFLYFLGMDDSGVLDRCTRDDCGDGGQRDTVV